MQRTVKNILLAAGAGVSLAVLTGCESMGSRTAGTYYDDHSINNRVEAALKDEAVFKFPTVKVTTYRGSTQLAGFVETEDQKKRAAEIARMVNGPSEIINNITVQAPPRYVGGVNDQGTGRERGSSEKAPVHENK